MKSGLTILIQAPEVPFLVPPKRLKRPYCAQFFCRYMLVIHIDRDNNDRYSVDGEVVADKPARLNLSFAPRLL